MNIEKIVLPTDFSEHSKAAVPYAIDLARKYKAELHLIHVFDDKALDPVLVAYSNSVKEYLGKMRGGFDEAVEKLTAEFDTTDLNLVKVFISGIPFLEIVRYAQKNCADIIVMGSQGRTGLAHMFLGSTTEKVLRKAPCPVLAVRNPVTCDSPFPPGK
jgi:universal stress protein A